MKIAAIAGNNRKESINKKIIQFMKERYKDKIDIEIVSIENLPMYNEDHELMPPDIVTEFKSEIADCDGVLIATPEYNHSITAVLKNALDWCSRVDRVMENKPVMIIGATPGILGTVRAQEHLRQILNSPGISAITMPGNEVFIGQVHEKVDESGNIIHEPTLKFLDSIMDQFKLWVRKINK